MTDSKPNQLRAPPSDRTVSDALVRFHAPHVEEIWETALHRRANDPKGALTSARELLESVCKHILDDAGVSYENVYELNQLYYHAAKVLEIAPNQQTEYDFRRILGACATIVESIGNLRSDLGDAHGRGKNSPRPDPQHAELVVNLAGVMASHLVTIWENRQRTIGDVVRAYLTDAPAKDTRRFNLERFLRSPFANVVAARAIPRHIVEYADGRVEAGASPPTIRQDLGALKRPFAMARSAWGIEAPFIALNQAWTTLWEKKIISSSTQRERRPTAEELKRLRKLFEDQSRLRRTKIPMDVLMDFAIESARYLGDICSLRWSDVTPKEFTEEAWAIIQAQRQIDNRVFPYHKNSHGQHFICSPEDREGGSASAKAVRRWPR